MTGAIERASRAEMRGARFDSGARAPLDVASRVLYLTG